MTGSNRFTSSWAIISLVALVIFQPALSQEIAIPRISPKPTVIPGIQKMEISLDGIWRFHPDFLKASKIDPEEANWSNIQVPGEWAMQSFKVDSGQAAAYFKSFTLPKNWNGKRIKLRFNGVYSLCKIWVNGNLAGQHQGGFTAFEIDVTSWVNFSDSNTILLSVQNESLEDSLASGSRYACHPLGGINRSVCLFPLSNTNLAALSIETIFDTDYQNATLKTNFTVSNESESRQDNLHIRYSFARWPDGNVTTTHDHVPVGELDSNTNKELQISVPVDRPAQWDCENPNLYLLTVDLLQNDVPIESIQQRFGFRQSEVKNNQLFINGKAVKLRGVNRHEVYPLTGRTVPKEMYRRDIELFREGNVNHIRTCHYPPDQALMEAADELGMFIECEGPFCWSHETEADPKKVQDAITTQNLEMIVLYRNHPSVIFWSIANESTWTQEYEYAGKAMKALDPSRPLTFNYFPWAWVKNHSEDEEVCALGSDHYPSPTGPEKYANYHRPISFGEFVHLNAYNRYELATDVALRDLWGIYLHDMWENMYQAQGVAGGSIWAGIDDTFYWDFPLDDGSIEERTIGYGTWGPIDGWRRKKPEWWGMKKTYSPIRILDTHASDSLIILDVENRQDFSNLNRLIVKWKLGDEYGKVTADIPAKESGQLFIKPKSKMRSAADLEILFEDPRGFIVDSFVVPLTSKISEYKVPEYKTNRIRIRENGDDIEIKSLDQEYVINKQTGLIYTAQFTGPYLMILPLNTGGDTQMHGPTKYYEPYTHTCTDWEIKAYEFDKQAGGQVIKIHGSYKEAIGTYTYTFTPSGGLVIDYDFKSTEDVSPRQLGLVFEVPKSYETLSWKRKGYWSSYPDWHIARLEGSAKASEGFEATPVGPRTKPEHEWRHDRTSIGSNDFASTKHNIYWASLLDKQGKGLKVQSKGHQHSRTWLQGENIRFLIADYSNGGSERFLRPHSKKDDKPLKKGDPLKGSINIRITK